MLINPEIFLKLNSNLSQALLRSLITRKLISILNSILKKKVYLLKFRSCFLLLYFVIKS